jgi:hypothetical protein
MGETVMMKSLEKLFKGRRDFTVLCGALLPALRA